MSRPERGAYGNKRGKERQRRRTNRRMEDPRVTRALSEANEQNAALEKLPARPGKAVGAQYSDLVKAVLKPSEPEPVEPTAPPPVRRRPTPAPAGPPLPAPDAVGEKGWTLAQARGMLRQGYRLERVQRMTGFGADWFNDIPVSDSGHGINNLKGQ